MLNPFLNPSMEHDNYTKQKPSCSTIHRRNNKRAKPPSQIKISSNLHRAGALQSHNKNKIWARKPHPWSRCDMRTIRVMEARIWGGLGDE
ncbi:hypothetical protein Zmor_012314 [Zophobas morio]|uniref:Uncharacterized protein n=1 Tax=Zophobas morio TaxID=2755281 RepID=A0AA38HGA6_9CUCU|nr:hypothetical protein Zmor_012314 [Zophobas morio]